MELPFVSRALYDQAHQQIADLKEANGKLWDLVNSKQAAAAEAEPEEAPDPPRQHRKLGSQLRAEFREEAEERFKRDQSAKVKS